MENTDFIEDTIDFWSKRYEQKITATDANEIINNVSGFFQLLAEWDLKDKEVQSRETISVIEECEK